MLIADVSGKGTSAALYMAELKGLVLSLSQIYLSPRQLLIEVNRIISDNLDTRSFITMTYAVIDLEAGRMTYARAGHTPLIYMRSRGADEGVQVLVPSGMVVGLRIPGAHEKFIELLEEETLDLEQRRRHRPLHRRHQRGDERATPTCSATRGSAGSSRSTATSSRASCASASCARSSRSSAAPISTTT